MLSYEDTRDRLPGQRERARGLRRALARPMSTMLPADESGCLIKWVQEGADRSNYETVIKPLLDKRCATCHDGSNPHLAQSGRIR